MKTPLSIITSMTILIATAMAENKATAEWLIHPDSQNDSGKIHTVIRMTVDEGWHTYWVNPGEGGMPPKLVATLPDGWTISEIQYPMPKRFLTGELPGFGYEGTVDFPVTITPAEGKYADTGISAKLDWLTCDDGSCLPGEAELSLKIAEDPSIVEQAYAALSKPIPGTLLKVASAEENVVFSLQTAKDSAFLPESITDVFPKTSDTVDAGAPIVFKEDPDTPGTWIATVPKSEYLSGEPGAVTLVIATEGEAGKSLWEITSSVD